MDDIGVLSSVLGKVGDLIAAVRPDQSAVRTPCPEYTVGNLVNHMVSWAQVFAAAAQGELYEGDPAQYRTGGDPAAEFRTAATSMVAGWADHGLDRAVRLTGGELPGRMVFNMTLMEFLTHGWDLARATGQQVPFSDDEASETLARAQQTLPPEYRGPDRAFGEIVDVPADAAPLDRLIGFMGRRP